MKNMPRNLENVGSRQRRNYEPLGMCHHLGGMALSCSSPILQYPSVDFRRSQRACDSTLAASLAAPPATTYPPSPRSLGDSPLLIPVNQARRDRAHIRAGADHEKDDEKQGLEVEKRRLDRRDGSYESTEFQGGYMRTILARWSAEAREKRAVPERFRSWSWSSAGELTCSPSSLPSSHVANSIGNY